MSKTIFVFFLSYSYTFEFAELNLQIVDQMKCDAMAL